MNKIEIISNYLDKHYANPRSELNYNKDYELLLAVVMSAQTTDLRVNSVTEKLFKIYPSLEALANAKLADIEKIIRSIGTYKKKAVFIQEIARELLKKGYLPNDREFLESLPGVGRKTASVVLSNLFAVPAIAVDTHVARVSKRLALASEKDDVLEIEKKLMKKFPKENWIKLHHQMILFGRYHCKAIKPLCETCGLQEQCNYYKKRLK